MQYEKIKVEYDKINNSLEDKEFIILSDIAVDYNFKLEKYLNGYRLNILTDYLYFTELKEVFYYFERYRKNDL